MTEESDMATPSQRTDEELLTAWQEGDLDAGNAFIERHFLSVSRFFSTKLAREADDLTQQTFADLQRAVGRVRQRDRGRAYVMKIARNRLYMHLRARAVQDRVFDPATTSIAGVDPKASPSAVVAKRRDARMLLRALRTIPLQSQIVLELYYWEELSVGEIAEITGVAPGTVMSRLYRSRAKLNRALANLGETAGAMSGTSIGLDTWAAGIRGLALACG